MFQPLNKSSDIIHPFLKHPNKVPTGTPFFKQPFIHTRLNIIRGGMNSCCCIYATYNSKGQTSFTTCKCTSLISFFLSNYFGWFVNSGQTCFVNVIYLISSELEFILYGFIIKESINTFFIESPGPGPGPGHSCCFLSSQR